MARRRSNRTREYQRSARLNELLREIIAEELERIDDDRLDWVSVVSIEVDNELTKARVYLSSLKRMRMKLSKCFLNIEVSFGKLLEGQRVSAVCQTLYL